MVLKSFKQEGHKLDKEEMSVIGDNVFVNVTIFIT